MHDLFASPSLAGDLLGPAGPAARPSASTSTVPSMDGGWALADAWPTGSSQAVAAGSSAQDGQGLDPSFTEPVLGQLQGLDFVTSIRPRLDGNVQRVTLTLGWLGPGGRKREADIDVVVTAGKCDVTIAGKTYSMPKPAVLVYGAMRASNMLGAAVRDAVSREPERQDERRRQMERRDGAGAIRWPGTDRAQAGTVQEPWQTTLAQALDANGIGGAWRIGDYGLNTPPIPEFRMPGLSMGTATPMPELSDQALADARRTEELRQAGMAPVRELLRGPDGAPPTEFNYHGGVVDVVYGRSHTKITINTTTGGVVIGGRVQLTKRPAERVGGTAMVSADVLDLAKAADAAAMNRRPTALPGGQIERLFDQHGIARLSVPAAESASDRRYRAPDGLITDGVNAIARWSPDNALSLALANWWHNPETQMGLARAEGLFWRGMVGYFDLWEPSWEFLAGAGDSLTVVGTRSARALFCGASGWPDVDPSGTAYVAGEWSEFAVEVAMCGASKYLKGKLSRELAESGLTWQKYRSTKFRFTDAQRARAKAAWADSGRTGEFNMHHANTLLGHSRWRNSLLPMGGLDRELANGCWNIELVGRGAPHTARHVTLQAYEDWAAGLVNRQTMMLRAVSNTPYIHGPGCRND